jgi:hypothetical protein
LGALPVKQFVFQIFPDIQIFIYLKF